MNERERLIRIIEQCSWAHSPPCTSECYECNRGEMYDKEIANIADILLAHGVTIPAQGRLVKHNYLGHEQWTCSECQTLVSPQWKCCPVCEARMPESPKEE